MTLKRKREVVALLEKKGIQLLSFGTTRGGGHYEATIRAPNGTIRRFPVAKTPGDHRADENMVSQMRSWCSGNSASPDAVIAPALKAKAGEFKFVRALMPTPRGDAVKKKAKPFDLRAMAKTTLFNKADLAEMSY
ncbi:hypothetical protein D3C71_77710 [compost metagenome]